MSDYLCRLRKGGQGCDVVKGGILCKADGIWQVEEALVGVFERHLDDD